MFKVVTPPTTEPLTLAEVKRHLKIYDDGINDAQTETITTRAANVGTVTGTSVDVLGASATVYVNVGVISFGGKLDVEIQHSDDNISFSVWESIPQMLISGSYSKLYEGGKRYIKAVASVTVNSITFGANVQTISGDPTDDVEIADLITRAREQAEEYSRQAFAVQTIEFYLKNYPSKNYIEIPMPPLQSVTSLKTYDRAGNATTESGYIVDIDSVPGKIVLEYGKSWPTGADYPVNPIRIRAVVGYSTLPQKLKRILLYHIGLLDKYRDVAIPEAEQKALEQMYNSYRVSWHGGSEL